MRGKKKTFSYLVLLALLLGSTAFSASEEDQPARPKAHGILVNYFDAPISFEPNQGQADVQVKFMARGAGYNLFLTPRNALFSFRASGESRGTTPADRGVLAMDFLGASPAPSISGKDELTGRSSYFFGHDPGNWHTNIPNFGKVEYTNIYPGIDLVFHGTQGQLEYDFVVHPGATPRTIAIKFTGAKRITVDPRGELVLQAGTGRICFHKPAAYQREGTTKRPVTAQYRIAGKNQISFVVGAYDSNKPLIIDPVLDVHPRPRLNQKSKNLPQYTLEH
jgi:hypothetical protein